MPSDAPFHSRHWRVLQLPLVQASISLHPCPVNPTRTGHSRRPWWGPKPSCELHVVVIRVVIARADRRGAATPLRSGPMALPAPKENTTAIVTGASSGIGAEIARELARRGHGLTLVARREDRLRAVAGGLGRTQAARTEVIAADLTDADARGALPARLADLGLTPDILVNNAGFTTMGPVHKSDRAAELAMIRTNVEAVVDLCTLFVAGMVTRHRGAVLNTASTAAFQPLPGQAGYGASKAVVLSYTRALGAELRGSGITVTTLCPGPVETGFAESAGMTDAEASES